MLLLGVVGVPVDVSEGGYGGVEEGTLAVTTEVEFVEEKYPAVIADDYWSISSHPLSLDTPHLHPRTRRSQLEIIFLLAAVAFSLSPQ